jgi:hypothetical protein
MLHDTPADASFKSCADHLARQAGLQLLEQRPGITLLQRPAHQPAWPGLALLRQEMGQGFIQRHRQPCSQARQLLEL